MYRRFALTAAAALLAVTATTTPVAAQDDPGAHVYLAYFKVNFDDLEEYLALFQENDVPLLNELVEEGVLTGFGIQQHNTGGEYNIRFAARSNDWNSLGDFWAKYLERYEQRHPADFARANAGCVA